MVKIDTKIELKQIVKEYCFKINLEYKISFIQVLLNIDN